MAKLKYPHQRLVFLPRLLKRAIDPRQEQVKKLMRLMKPKTVIRMICNALSPDYAYGNKILNIVPFPTTLSTSIFP